MKNKQHQYIIGQMLFWIAFYAFQVFSNYKLVDFNQNIINSLVYSILVCGLVYLNVQYLIPKFFLTKKYVVYFFWALTITFIVGYLYYFFENTDRDEFFFDNLFIENEFLTQTDFIYPFVEFLVIIGAISSIFIAFQQNQVREQLIKTEKENINSQLEVLKSQTNPHFLFNVLNSIHFLIYKNQDKASETLLKLSDLLRYQLYETNTTVVPLQNELKHINNYIDLELMRIGKNITFTSNLNEEHSNITIPPFLLLPLIENAFKHSANVSDRFIDFYIKIYENKLIFKTKNSIGKESAQKSGGLGLTNLKHRLALLYPQKHTFLVEKTDKEFTTRLKIYL